VEHVGQPTVILAHTIKGWTLGPDFEARNATHQMKKLTVAELKEFRDRLYLPIPDAALEAALPPYYHPGEESDEIQYMRERRAALGGYLPKRVVRGKPLKLPGDPVYAELRRGSGKQPVATTMAFVRLLKDLMKDSGIGARFVPIIPDEARTFGMDSLFPTAKIYSPHGQTYEAVDRNLLLSYKESEKGQILHEGITEDGAMGSMIAAGTAYATHSTHMIPVYIFYSMFGWQRTGDQMWALGDQLGRGFLLGATAGRTTLTGEGLQHNDGHSVLLASVSEACVSYDAGYAVPAARRAGELPRRQGRARAGHPARAVPVRARPGRRARGRRGSSAGPDPGLRCGRAGRAPGPAAAGRRLGCVRVGVVRHLVDRAAPGRHGRRGVEPAAPRRGAARSVCDRGAGRPAGPGRGGQRLDPGRPGPDRPLGAGPVHLARHRRLRLL
jgi:pyruvate dehydrogenase E1 component